MVLKNTLRAGAHTYIQAWWQRWALAARGGGICLATRGGVAVAARGGGSVQQGGGSEAVAERCRLQRGGGSEGRWLRHSGSEWQRGGGSEAEASKAVASNRWWQRDGGCDAVAARRWQREAVAGRRERRGGCQETRR